MLLSLDNYELLTRRQNDSLYILQPGTKWEDKNAAKTYVCPNAEGANKTSDYCIFNNVSDAEKWCSADSGCQGYVVTPSGTTYQASNNIQSGNGNGLFMMKRQQALPPPSTT
jgi:hypothetical protein